MGLFRKIFPSRNDRRLKKINKIVDKIEALADTFKAMTDEELQGCTQKYIDRYNEGESLDSLLPEAFATMREASERVLGMRHFRVQLIGGVVLYQGRIAEMRTGEGKTLVATLPAYLQAIAKKGVHIVTVNEYLAKRDAEWMGKVFKFLGLTVGVNYSGLREKVEAYNCDILYSTNSELGFDYLKDNMAKDKSQRVQRGLDFVIVDEMDSILIDEARTPLIISGRGGKPSDEYVRANEFVKRLVAPVQKKVEEEELDEEEIDSQDEEFESKKSKKQSKQQIEETVLDDAEQEEEIQPDFEIGEKEKSVYLNEYGAQKAEQFYGIENLSDYENQSIKHYIDNALRANFIMKEGVNYIVVDKEVIIIDEFTGRQMIGRRFSDGLHQAIEAKENVPIRSEDKTLATITFQNFFRLYKKMSGMTGTAKTEENEFEAIYGLDVVVVPTNKPVQRIDEPDRLYKSRAGKYNALLQEISQCYQKGQPVLIGTISVEKSEELSRILNKNKIKHNVLNAKNHEKEAEIIAQAGKKGAVTIATNMAGRGTDILLGGNPDFLARQALERAGVAHEIIEQATMLTQTQDEEVLAARAEYKRQYDNFAKQTAEEKQEVLQLGGLRIIGTERNEARRIDNQLRGRSGRQGDPGSSVFFISLEDEMIKAFGGEQLKRLSDMLDIPDDVVIASKIVSKSVERTQASVEDRNFSVRKNVLGYDDVMNTQRTIIYEQRNLILDDMDVHQQVLAMMRSVIERICNFYVNTKEDHSLWDYDGFNKALEDGVLKEGTQLVSEDYVSKVEDNSFDGLVDSITKVAIEQYEEKCKEADEILAENGETYTFSAFEKECMLYNVDKKWMDHIDAMDQLKQGIGLVAYAQRDPVMQYKIEGLDMFEKMVESIQDETVRVLVKSKLEKAPVKKEQTGEIYTNEHAKPKTERRQTRKIGPNEKCPCGSGKKYKYCCGK
ncbi:MAG: preprotein translocase subunit SecA [Clostridia bacterium]|nr:preprotein translocase subunit SecA [Clostridia bacterium]MCI9291541.1 preprotein translocase subunit SecA [Clostridia bacterium]